MARIAGIKFNKSVSGKPKSVTIDLKRWGSYLEDFLDLIEYERIKNGPDGEIVANHEDVKKMLEKKFKIKL